MLYIALSLIFLLGYAAIICEHLLHVNKAAIALIMAVICWVFYVSSGKESASVMAESVYEVAQIIFFLLAVMVIVELIDSHHGFKIITDLIYTSSLRHMLWLLVFLAFFMSAALDNLTTMIVMTSLLRKLIHPQRERWLMGALLVITVNAGGAWTPIGDVTTTLLWIHGCITIWATIKFLFLPSLVSVLISGALITPLIKGNNTPPPHECALQPMAPGARCVFFLGLISLIMIPMWKVVLDLPPFMGALIALGFMWLLTDLMHLRFHEERLHLRVAHIMTKIDMSGLLFFLGILLAISALDAIGLLQMLSNQLNVHSHNTYLLATLIGMVSSIIDNVPLVAAMIGMYPLETFPTDSTLWQLTAYTTGTGGSLLLIGSAAGVVWMGMEKVPFFWYVKHISWIALVSYFSGIFIYMLF